MSDYYNIFDDGNNSVPVPIDWSSVKPLPPVTDTTPPTLCTESSEISKNQTIRNIESFAKK